MGPKRLQEIKQKLEPEQSIVQLVIGETFALVGYYGKIKRLQGAHLGKILIYGVYTEEGDSPLGISVKMGELSGDLQHIPADKIISLVVVSPINAVQIINSLL